MAFLESIGGLALGLLGAALAAALACIGQQVDEQQVHRGKGHRQRR